MRVPHALLACALGLTTALPVTLASADPWRGGGAGDHRPGPSFTHGRPGHADHFRRHPDRRHAHRRHRHRHRHRLHSAYRYGYSDYYRDARRGFVDERAVYDEAAAVRAIRERGRVATAAAATQSWRLWQRPEDLYGPPPTAPRDVQSLLAEEGSADLEGTFCVEGEVVLPDPPTPAARAFCRRGR